MLFVPVMPSARGTSLINTIKNLGLTSGLKLCLDPGDLNSYDGSSQIWKDLSGGGYDFNRGSGSSSDAADPTFNGTAGKLSSGEYFSFDGGDWLTLGQVNPSWVNDMHKDNAKFSLIAWLYSPNIATGTSEIIFGTADNQTASVGVDIAIGGISDGDFGFAMRNSLGTTNRVLTASARLVSAQFNFVGLSYDESAGSVVLRINSSQETPSLSYTSPSAASASYTARIGDGGNGNRPLKANDRLGQIAVWGGIAIGATALSSIFTATRGRYGV